MPESTVITEEMRRAIGSLINVNITVIEKGLIKDLVTAVGDSNPLWTDDEYARTCGWGASVVPPSLFLTVRLDGSSPTSCIPFELPLKRPLDGGGEWEFYKPVRVGDVVVTTRKLVDVYERQSKMGTLLFVTFESTYMNQKGETVGKARYYAIRY
jgi:acyl dehydratase